MPVVYVIVMHSASYFVRNIEPGAMVAYTSVGFCVAVRHLMGNARSLSS
jgi:hypothetical protein